MIYSKFNDINAVLSKANHLLSIIEEKYSKSLNNQVIDYELLVEIKDYLGNLRSGLDYLGKKLKIEKFPVENSYKDFLNKVKSLDNKYLDILEKIQPYNDNDIKNFNILNNKNKHLTLIPQKRNEIKQITVSNSIGSISWGDGVKFGNGVSIMGVPIDSKTQLPIPNNQIKTEITIWIDFIFDNTDIGNLDSNISALPFLKNIFSKVINIISEIESNI